jgi:hypothetical protein
MGKIIRGKMFNKLGQRKGKVGSVYTTPKSKRIAPPRYRNLDFAERQGYIKVLSDQLFMIQEEEPLS